MKNNPIKLLMLEDNNDDAHLIKAILNRSELNFDIQLVDDKNSFINALNNFCPDIVLSDHQLAQFNSVEALQITQDKIPPIPFILVTGTVSEEFAASIIKAGADDYILKDRLMRLPAAIDAALKKRWAERDKEEAENKRRESEEQYRIIMERVSDAFVSIDKNWCYTYVNKKAGEIMHRQPADLIGKNIWAEFPDGIGKPFHKAYYQAIETQQHIHLEEYYPPFDVWLENHIYPSENGLSIFFRNITASKKAEQQKEFDSNNLRALINNTKDLMWSVDTDFNLIAFNDAFDKTVELMSGKRIAKGENLLINQFTEEQINYFRKHYKRAFAGETFTEVIHNEEPIDFWSEISFYPIFNKQEVIGTACFSRNITERKHIEIERRKIASDLLQRNKDLEQFTYIVSHNLRAPLANIKGLTYILEKNKPDCPENMDFINMLSVSANRMDEVVMDLNNILNTRNDLNEVNQKVIFSSLVNDIMVSLNHIIDQKQIAFDIDFSAVDMLVSRKAFLYSIFYNLITNSIKYRQQEMPLHILIKSSKLEGMVKLSFSDNGLGIDMTRNHDKVFRLYNRFHSHVDGKGLGLFMVKTQVEALEGTIAIESEVNKGTDFTIVLPILHN